MRLCDADAVLEIVMQYCPDDDGSCSKSHVDMRDMLDDIENLPTIEAEPVRHERWIFVKDILPDFKRYECSGCKHEKLVVRTFPNYCESCGAKMDGGDNHE